ncbi:MAG: EsaB/YukD family protein [Chitinophagales bacterium]
MANITIVLKDSTTGREVEIELPNDLPIRDLLPAITHALGIEYAEQRQLQNKTQSFDYLEADTLATRQTKNGDLCILKYETIQGFC